MWAKKYEVWGPRGRLYVMHDMASRCLRPRVQQLSSVGVSLPVTAVYARTASPSARDSLVRSQVVSAAWGRDFTPRRM